jgi:hypothetical protein
MSQPAIAASAPTSFLRRAFEWWVAQVKHALPPTIFFFVGFNLILWTKRLILEEHGIDYTGFFTATVANGPDGDFCRILPLLFTGEAADSRCET